jgi:hypothetical protein
MGGDTTRDKAMTRRLNLTDSVRDGLLALRSARKFDAYGTYAGAPDEMVRARCESGINALLDSLLHGLPEQPTKDFVLLKFKEHLDSLNREDTEERDRACGYCEEVMDIFGIESSEGVLNTWRYGFDPDQVSRISKEMSTEQTRRVLEERAEQLYAELLRSGTPDSL